MEVAGPIYRGAESFIYRIRWGSRRALLKKRIPKAYRHPSLDKAIRRSRVLAEARMILAASLAGVPVPAVYYVDPDEALIVIEEVEGMLLRDLIDKEGATPRVQNITSKLGYYVGILHNNNIVHGDLTTSNVIVEFNDEPVIIDFGLSEKSMSEEDKAVDVHLFLRSLESTHPDHASILYKSFAKGYEEARGRDKLTIIEENVKRIRLMGRYVEERRRRKTVWSLNLKGR